MKHSRTDNFKNKFKKVASYTTASVLALSAICGMSAPINTTQPLFAQGSSFVETGITNSNFDATSTSSYPKKASDWAILNENSGIKAGIVSLDSDIFSLNDDSYGLYYENSMAYPDNHSSPNAYMMNAMKSTATYGIESPEITLDANCYYAIKVNIRTSVKVLSEGVGTQIASHASMYLKIGDKIVASKLNINTNNQWSTYYFFVSTNFEGETKAKVQLYLGSKEFPSSGAVLFDNLSCIKYTPSAYTNKKLDIAASNQVEYIGNESLSNAEFANKTDVTLSLFEDSNFQDISKWEKKTHGNTTRSKSGIVDISQNLYSPADTLGEQNPYTNSISTDNNVMFINSLAFDDEEVGASISYTTSQSFVIKRYANYLIQFYVKTSNITGDGFHASIVPNDDEYNTVSLTGITSTTNPINNDWSLCSIYIQGNSYEDVEAKLEFGLGSIDKEVHASGCVFIDNLKAYQISYDKYSASSAGARVGKGAFSKSSSIESKFENAGFDNVSETAGVTSPYAPAKWTSTNENNTTSGIINNKYIGFNENNEYGNLSWESVGLTSNQNFIDVNIAEELNIANQNLLMINTLGSGYQSYKNTTEDLNASTLYKLSVDAKSLVEGAFIKVSFGDLTIHYNEIAPSNEFAVQELYFITPMAQSTLTVELGLGTSDNITYGHAFFDCVVLEEVNLDENQTPSEALESIIETKYVSSIDLLTNYFEYVPGSENAVGLFTPLSWKIENETAVNSGIKYNQSGNSLLISSEKSSTNHKIESNRTYSLDNAGYYKVCFTVKTSSFTDLIDSGVEFGFNEMQKDNQFFKNIIASEDESVYEFYIKGEDYASITPYFALNTSNATNTEFGELVNFSIEKINQSVFSVKMNDIKENAEEYTNVIMLGEVEEESSDNHNHSNINPTDSSIWTWALPTIVTCLSILLAIIGLIVKKAKRNAKKRGKKYTNPYDRHTTIHQAILDKEVEELREQKLADIKEKLIAIREKLKVLEDNYKDKIADENVNKESEYKKLVRHRKKHATLEKQLEEQLEFVQSDEFTLSAMHDVIDKYEKEADKFAQDNDLEKDDEDTIVIDGEQAISSQEIIEASSSDNEGVVETDKQTQDENIKNDDKK